MQHLASDGTKAPQQCPCGYRTHPQKECRCSVGEVQRYMGRLSGPLLDRIDIHVDVPALTYAEISDRQPSGPTSASVRQQVQDSRDRQRARYNSGTASNARVDAKTLRNHCDLVPAAEKLLETALDQLGLSARAYDKVLRVARTIADLDHADTITEPHVAEAVQYRTLDRGLV